MAAKMSANVFSGKAFRSQKPSRLGPDVPRDSGRRFGAASDPAYRWHFFFLLRYFRRLFTFSYARVASSQRGLKIQRGLGIG